MKNPPVKKTTGPDGLSGEYYQIFKEIIWMLSSENREDGDIS